MFRNCFEEKSSSSTHPLLSDESQILNTHVLTKRYDQLFVRMNGPRRYRSN